MDGVGLVTQRLRVRVSGPVVIVGEGSECPALSPPSTTTEVWDPWVCVCSLLTAVCAHLDGLNAEY